MNIALLEPLGVPDTLIEQLSQPIRDAGHSFVYYRRKAGSTEELAQRSEGCEVVMIANTRYPDEVVRSASQLRMLDVAFTGIDHVGLAACREKDVMICNAANYSNQTVA